MTPTLLSACALSSRGSLSGVPRSSASTRSKPASAASVRRSAEVDLGQGEDRAQRSGSEGETLLDPAPRRGGVAVRQGIDSLLEQARSAAPALLCRVALRVLEQRHELGAVDLGPRLPGRILDQRRGELAVGRLGVAELEFEPGRGSPQA